MAKQAGDGDFEKLSVCFIDWLKQNGTNISPKIDLVDFRKRNAGRGVIAKEDIEEDEELFRIPKLSILTPETSAIPTELIEGLSDPWLQLILAMVYEFQRGPESSWKPYFDVLPEEYDTLMYWSDQELQSLEGSAVVHKIGKTTADKMFIEQLVPIIREHESAFQTQTLRDTDLLRLCHRMGSTIMAYAFDLENTTAQSTTENDDWEEDSDTGVALSKGMVPLADMLNADADLNNAKLFYENEQVVMKSIKPISNGDELFNDYGPLPRADLLRRYGYITDNYAKYDVVEISLDLVKKAAKEELNMQEEDIEMRTEYLDEEDVLDDGYDLSHASSEEGIFSKDLTILLNALVLPKSDFDRLRKKEKLPKPGLSNEALGLLYSILVRRRSMYPSDKETPENGIVQNDMSHNGDSDGPRTHRRRIIAFEVIDGEKQILYAAADDVQKRLGGEKRRQADSFETDAMALRLSSKKKREEDVN